MITMKKRQPGHRPAILDILEDRAVPSAGMSAVHVASGAGSNAATVLNQVGPQVNAAYSAFATAVRQAEVALVAGTTAGNGRTAGPSISAATASNQVAQQITALSASLAGTLGSATGLASARGPIQAELTGATPGSLSSRMAALFAAAAAPDGSIPSSSLPLLFAAVDGAIAGSYSSTAVNIYYDAIGRAGTGSKGAGGSTAGGSFDLTTIGEEQSAAYSALATAVRQAEATLVGAGTAAPTGTAATVEATAMRQINSLSQSISSSLGSTPAAATTGVLQALDTDASPGSLSGQIAALFAAAGAGGTIPQASLPLLFSAVDGAINASYASTAVNTYLIASSPIYNQAGRSTGAASNSSGTIGNIGGGPTGTSGGTSGRTGTGTGSTGSTTGTSGTGTTGFNTGTGTTGSTIGTGTLGSSTGTVTTGPIGSTTGTFGTTTGNTGITTGNTGTTTGNIPITTGTIPIPTGLGTTSSGTTGTSGSAGTTASGGGISGVSGIGNTAGSGSTVGGTSIGSSSTGA